VTFLGTGIADCERCACVAMAGRQSTVRLDWTVREAIGDVIRADASMKEIEQLSLCHPVTQRSNPFHDSTPWFSISKKRQQGHKRVYYTVRNILSPRAHYLRGK
jgi:hypothetical protein